MYTMNKLFQGLLIMTMILLLSACDNLPPISGEQQTPGKHVSSNKKRVTTPDVTPTDLAELVDGSSSFNFNLYQVLKEENDNFFYSPYSISLALAMTFAGARGETEQQMADTLHFLLSQQRLHPTFNGLDLALASRGDGAQGKDGEGFRLNIVNAIWGQEGYQFLPQFLDVLALNYGAELKLLDFVAEPEASRAAINLWVSEQTEDRIEELIPQGVINTLTRLVLTNAITFNAAWAEPFEAEMTTDGPFHLLDGRQISVPMMRQTESFAYTEGDGYQALALPYDGQELEMVILLPDAGTFTAFEDEIDAARVDTIISNLEHNQVSVTMPRFEYESGFSLRDALSAMGMADAFSRDADFSGMDGTRDLFIRDVVHKAFVSVDEAGTEAAAATAVVMEKMMASPQQPLEFAVDRPFIFLIRDIETGSILFTGRLVNPTAGQQ